MRCWSWLRVQDSLGSTLDNWDAVFSDNWRTSDLIDCILSYAATELVKKTTRNNEEGKQVRGHVL